MTQQQKKTCRTNRARYLDCLTLNVPGEKKKSVYVLPEVLSLFLPLVRVFLCGVHVRVKTNYLVQRQGNE